MTMLDRARPKSALLLLVAVLLGLALTTSPANASRKPSRAAATAIKEVALAACDVPGRQCRFLNSRVSTVNGRFAWANVGGEGFSAVLLKRPRASSLRFRVVGIQGGGINECSYWRKRAPRPVLRDLRVGGLLNDTGATGNCG